MPGPKAKPSIIFRDLYLKVNRLREISTTKQQRKLAIKLFKGLNVIEPAWGDERAFVGTIVPIDQDAEPVSPPDPTIQLEIDRAYMAGVEAAQGWAPDINPFDADTQSAQHQAWNSGCYQQE
jgi:hypothetical protein